MAYVDLTSIRAKVNTTPETSKHTTIKQRIHFLIKGEQPRKLMRFLGNHRQNMSKDIAFSLLDYCELVDSTGRCIREEKVCYIDHSHNPILERIGPKKLETLILKHEKLADYQDIILVDYTVIGCFITLRVFVIFFVNA